MVDLDLHVLFLDLCTIFYLETRMYIASGIDDGGVILTIYMYP